MDLNDTKGFDISKMSLEYIEKTFMNEKFHELVLELSADMFSLHDKKGNYLFASSASLSLIGFFPDELIGLNAYELFHPDDILRIAEHHNKTIGKSILPPVSYRIRRKDGTYIWVETSNRFMNNSETGEIEIIISVTRDIGERKKIEDELVQSRENYLKLTESIDDVFLALNKNFEINYWNKTAESITGLKREDVIGKQLINFFPTLASHQIFDFFRKVIKEQKSNNIDVSYEFEGINYIYSVTAYPNEFGLSIIARNLTKIIENKKLLESSESRFQTLFNNTDDAIYVVDVSDVEVSGRIIEVNDIACKTLGYSREELLTMTPIDLDIDVDLSEFQQIMKNLAIEKKVIIESRHKAKDGRAIPVEVNVSYFELDGKATIVSVCRDISLRKNFEKTIKESERRFRAILDNIKLLAVIIDEKGTIWYANNFFYESAGWLQKDILAKNWFRNLLKEENIDEAKSIIKRVFNNEIKQESFQTKISTKFDSEKEIFWFVTPLYNIEDNQVVSIAALGYDITDRLNAQRQLVIAKEKAEKANELKSLIMTNMGHEIRTPLNSIINFAEIILMDESDSKLTMMVQNIKESGQRLDKTLQLILQLSNLESDKTQVKLDDCNVVDLINEYVLYYKNSANKKGIDLNIIIREEQVIASIDEVLFNEMIRQVVGNAIKFTESGFVNVELTSVTEKNAKFALISIIDSGIGIAENQLKKIFEPFRQASEGERRTHEGIGLGLTLAKKIVSLMNGTIEIISKEGQGTTINIMFPAKL